MYCQSCKTPIKLDSSLEDLSSAAFQQLINALPSESRQREHAGEFARSRIPNERRELFEVASKDASLAAQKQKLDAHESRAGASPQNAPEHPAMSFVMLTDSQVMGHSPDATHDAQSVSRGQTPAGPRKYTLAEANSLSDKMETSAKLFDILSARTEIDHPICTDCTSTLIDRLERRLAGAIREKDAFQDFLNNIEANAPTDEERERLERDLRNIEEQEKNAMTELESLEQEKMSLELEIAKLEEESRKLDEEEQAYWAERNDMEQTLAALQSEKDSINMRYAQDSRQLERLQRTNVFNDTFCISHDGGFATINGLRLGRTNPPTVDWPEINAAWGYTCLLLSTVADKLNYTFKEHRLVPMGSTSSIEKLPSPQRTSSGDLSASGERAVSLPLYHSGDLPLNLGFLTRNFNNGMVAFLQCLRELGAHVEKTTRGSGNHTGLKLPYEIDKDKIHDCSIKIASFSGGEESWTRACKCTLTCCKFLLAHVSNLQAPGAKDS